MSIDNENLEVNNVEQSQEPAFETIPPVQPLTAQTAEQAPAFEAPVFDQPAEPVDFGSAEDLDFSLFTGGDAGYQVLTNEKLQALAKKLPSWSLEPPAKYIK